MHRLFVAVRPPAEIRNRLLAVMQGVAGARWQSDEQLHLTLSFIGEVEPHLAEDVAAALSSIRHSRFSIGLSGIGSFEKRGRGALWVGVSPHDQLQALHKKVDQACRRAGANPDRRAYLPHITIARFGRESGPIDALIQSCGGLSSPPFQVDAFCLFESALTPDGPVYTIVERYPLS